MLRQIPIIIAAIFFSGLWPNSQTMAQTGPAGERIRLELERTDQLLSEANTSSSNSPLGQEAIARAEEIQQQAKNLYHQGRYRMALEMTLRAREILRAAIRRSSMAEESDQVVLRRLERAAELLDRVGATLTPDSDKGQRALYDATRENLQKAWDLYRSGRFRPAMRIVDQVENNARKILRRSDRFEKRNDAFERRFLGASNHIADLERCVKNNKIESAGILLEEARHALDMARKLADEQNIPSAMQSLENAHKLIQNGMRECTVPAAAPEMISSLEDRLAVLEERIPPDDSRAQKILKQIRRQIELARDHLNHSRPEAAVASIRAAQQGFQKLARIAKEYDI